MSVAAVCKSCGGPFTPKRAWQECCKQACANRLRQQRRREAGKCRDSQPAVSQPADRRDTAPCAPPMAPQAIVSKPTRVDSNPAPGFGHGYADRAGRHDLKPSPLDGKLVLPGDEYIIEMDSDGYPIMPECLRRKEAS
jgi:hypothetical protein